MQQQEAQLKIDRQPDLLFMCEKVGVFWNLSTVECTYGSRAEVPHSSRQLKMISSCKR